MQTYYELLHDALKCNLIKNCEFKNMCQEEQEEIIDKLIRNNIKEIAYNIWHLGYQLP